MNESVHEAVCAALSCLVDVAQEALLPEHAQRRIREVETRYPDVSMQLLWEVEAYDNSLHYDVLVRSVNGGTVSLSVCPDGALPWPLRGVRRWTEANLVQVNGRVLTMEDAVTFLDVLWNEAPIMERMIDACLIREELERNPVVLSDQELQSAMDGWRRARRLNTAEDTEQWMRQRGMTHLQLERLVAGNLTCSRLRQRISAGRVASYLDSHRSQFDVARVLRVELPDHDSAARFHARATVGTVGFVSALHEELASGDERTRCSFTSMRRSEILSEVEQQLFGVSPGDVVGPIRVGTLHIVACLLTLRPACDDAATYAEVEQILFDLWLAERRRHATVTWHWGRASDPA